MAESFANLLSESALTLAILAILLLGLLLYRLAQKLGDALEHQAATIDVLKIISRSTIDLEAVLLTLVSTAAELCKADAAGIIRPKDARENHVAHIGLPARYYQHLKNVPLAPGEDTLIGRVLLEGETVRIWDALTDVTLGSAPERACFRSWIGVPLMREGNPVGVMVLARTIARSTARKNRAGNVTSRLFWSRELPFSDREVELVTTFADEALIAIENAHLFDEIKNQRRQLELANTYKSRFLAAASHDLRQPLHALNLFVAQLRSETRADERKRLVERINAGVGSMNDLFDVLLDMSKLDADMLEPNVTKFPIQHLLKRMETTFAEAAREKGLRLGVVSCGDWVRSDFTLLERIMLNLVSNAVRYTTRGGVVIGCRRRGNRLRIDVCDSGVGISEDQQTNIFDEFYQLAQPQSGRLGGLGVGLSIVDRLGRLLNHPVELQSRLGKGSRFSVLVPVASPIREMADSSELRAKVVTDPVCGKLIVVIDDDALALDGMRGILQSWGCSVVTAGSDTAALARLADERQQPDLIISDYRLADGRTGIDAIARIRGSFGATVPAFLISGDTAPERLREASAGGYLLLHKPVAPMALRTTLSRVIRSHAASCNNL